MFFSRSYPALPFFPFIILIVSTFDTHQQLRKIDKVIGMFYLHESNNNGGSKELGPEDKDKLEKLLQVYMCFRFVLYFTFAAIHVLIYCFFRNELIA